MAGKVETPDLIFTGADYGRGKDWSAEVAGHVTPEGKLVITNIQTWRHELELKAEPEAARAAQEKQDGR